MMAEENKNTSDNRHFGTEMDVGHIPPQEGDEPTVDPMNVMAMGIEGDQALVDEVKEGDAIFPKRDFGLVNANGERQYYVEEVLDYWVNKDKTKDCFLVKWWNWDPSFNTWEISENLENAPLVVEEYFERNPDKAKMRQGVLRKQEQLAKKRGTRGRKEKKTSVAAGRRGRPVTRTISSSTVSNSNIENNKNSRVPPDLKKSINTNTIKIEKEKSSFPAAVSETTSQNNNNEDFSYYNWLLNDIPNEILDQQFRQIQAEQQQRDEAIRLEDNGNYAASCSPSNDSGIFEMEGQAEDENNDKSLEAPLPVAVDQEIIEITEIPIITLDSDNEDDISVPAASTVKSLSSVVRPMARGKRRIDIAPLLLEKQIKFEYNKEPRDQEIDIEFGNII